MKTTIAYGDNPAYYKEQIAKINLEVDFPMYLSKLGYTLLDKSAGSMEFQKDGDRIVVQIGREPVTYFNRNDSNDKGQFFKFLRFREDNFYKTVQKGIDIIGQVYDPTNLEIQRIKKGSKSIELNYNIVPLQRAGYLTNDRGISKEVLNSDSFKGRIFNAFHHKDDGGKIPNIAIPKYDLEGNIKNYILYNKPYRSTKDNELKKFRLVLNQKDNFLFYSKPVSGKSVQIVCGESIIDLLSYHQIHGKSDNLYVSFGGNVYKEKLDFFVSLHQKLSISKEVEVLSITDNDLSGYHFDLKIFASLINATNPNVYMEARIKKEKVSLLIHYNEKGIKVIDKDFKSFNFNLGMYSLTDDLSFTLVRCIRFSDKLALQFDLKDLTMGVDAAKITLPFKQLMNIISRQYLSFTANVSKSIGKDWNDDLLESKKVQFIPEVYTGKNLLEIGDKIELGTRLGPEGSSNIGTIKKLKANGVLVDFGLKTTYAIPFSSVVKIHKMKIGENIGQGVKKQKKNNILKNNIL